MSRQIFNLKVTLISLTVQSEINRLHILHDQYEDEQIKLNILLMCDFLIHLKHDIDELRSSEN